MQGFQSHQHIQLFQRETANEEEQFTQHHNKVDGIKEEPKCELVHLLGKNNKRMGLLDTGSTHDSTNNKELLINTKQTNRPIASRTNVGQRKMTK